MPTFLILMCGLTLESVYPRARIGGARALKVVERYSSTTSTSVCSTTLPTFHSLHISACLASHLSLSYLPFYSSSSPDLRLPFYVPILLSLFLVQQRGHPITFQVKVNIMYRNYCPLSQPRLLHS